MGQTHSRQREQTRRRDRRRPRRHGSRPHRRGTRPCGDALRTRRRTRRRNPHRQPRARVGAVSTGHRLAIERTQATRRRGSPQQPRSTPKTSRISKPMRSSSQPAHPRAARISKAPAERTRPPSPTFWPAASPQPAAASSWTKPATRPARRPPTSSPTPATKSRSSRANTALGETIGTTVRATLIGRLIDKGVTITALHAPVRVEPDGVVLRNVLTGTERRVPRRYGRVRIRRQSQRRALRKLRRVARRGRRIPHRRRVRTKASPRRNSGWRPHGACDLARCREP